MHICIYIYIYVHPLLHMISKRGHWHCHVDLCIGAFLCVLRRSSTDVLKNRLWGNKVAIPDSQSTSGPQNQECPHVFPGIMCLWARTEKVQRYVLFCLALTPPTMGKTAAPVSYDHTCPQSMITACQRINICACFGVWSCMSLQHQRAMLVADGHSETILLAFLSNNSKVSQIT